MKLFNKLLLLALCPVLLATGVLLAVFWFKSKQTLRVQMERLAAAQLDLEAGKISNIFEEFLAQTRLAAALPVMQTGDLNAILPRLAELQTVWSGKIEGLYYNTADGTVHATDGQTFNVRDRYYFPQLERGETIVTKALHSRNTDRPIVVVLVPIFDQEGRRLGAIGATVLIADLLKDITKISAGETGFAMLVDEDGRAVAPALSDDLQSAETFFHHPEALQQLPGLNSLATEMSRRSKGAFEFKHLSDPCTAFFQAVPPTGWRLALVYRNHELFAARKELGAFTVGIMCITLAGCVIAAFNLNRVLVAPLRSLAQTHAALAGGDLAARSNVSSSDEIGALATSFNSMADQLARQRQKEAEEIASHKRTEAALRQNESLLRDIINNVPSVIYLKDLEGRYMVVNRGFAELMSLPPEGIQGHTDAELFSPEQARKFSESDRVVLQLNQPFKYDELAPGNDGLRTYLSIKFPLRDLNGKVYGIGGIATDITDRMKTESALRESEDKFHAIFDQTFQFIGLTDTEGRILEANQTACRFAGVGREQVLGCYFWDTPWWTHSPAEQARAREGIQQAARGEFIRFETTHPAADGTTHFIDFSIKPILDKHGKVVLLLPEGRDITETRRTEQALHRMENHLRQTQKLEAIGTLAGGIAHDFNNILAAIIGNAGMAQAEIPEKHPTREFVDQIMQASERAAGLVKQILAFSRQQEQARSAVMLQPLVKEAFKLLRASIPATIEITAFIPPELPPVLADTTQIHQVLMNLGANAAHAMRDFGGRMTITLELVPKIDAQQYPELKHGPHIRLQVTDTGCGMDNRTVERIFEPFFTTKATGEGTGLGLAVVHGIVRSHNGAIRVTSEVGIGSVFEIYLPVQAGSSRTTPVARPILMPGQGEQILIVDDELSILAVVKRILERENYFVTSAPSAEAALDMMSTGKHFDLVLTDLTMPGMSGLDFARNLKRSRPDLPIILMTGYGSRISANDIQTVGIVELLHKPVSPAELTRAVKQALPARQRVGA